MPKLSVKDRITAMARDVLGPEMKALGFRRAGRVFWRNGPEVCHVATVATNRWGSSDKSSFDVQLGVFWHRVAEILDNPSVGKMPPLEYRCTFRIDLGRTISMPPKPSWKVTHSSDFDALGREVLADLLEYGLPWFEYRSDLSRVLESKRYRSRDEYGRHWIQELVNADAKIAFNMILGKKEAAIEGLKRCIENGHSESAISLAKRLKIAKKDFLPIKSRQGRH